MEPEVLPGHGGWPGPEPGRSAPDRPLPHRPVSERIRDWVVWFGPARLITVAASTLAIGIGGYWLLRTPAAPVEASLPYAAAAVSTTLDPSAGSAGSPGSPSSADGGLPPVSTMPATMLVHVAGAVVATGVYELAPTARVVDAVGSAGGFADDAHRDALNLAAPLHDGDRVYVPRIGEVAQIPAGVTGVAVSGAADAPTGPIDLNTATADELDTLPGVGPATAQAIIAHRGEQGPFSSVDQLADVRGIGPAKLESLRSLVTV